MNSGHSFSQSIKTNYVAFQVASESEAVGYNYVESSEQCKQHGLLSRNCPH